MEMEPSASSAVSDGCASGQADTTAVSITPSVILNLLHTFEQSCHEGSLPGHLESLKSRRIDVSVENLLALGSAVVKDVLSASVTDDAGTWTALLPKLKPMVVECFSVGISRLISELIKKNSVESQVMCSQDHATDEVDEFSLRIKTEVVTEDEVKYDPDALSADEEDDTEMEPVPEYCLTRRDPYFRTKDVPPHILYSQRGVRCKLCWLIIKDSKAVDKLVKHTREVHPHKATDSFLQKLRQDNAFDKVIGKGIRYCTCNYCKIFGLARFHKGFEKRRRFC